LGGLDVEADENPFGVGQIANDFADWWRQLADECRERQDLVVASELWIFEQVDYLDSISVAQVFTADFLQVRERRHRSGRLTSDVQAQKNIS
jgi:hypothetical protein